MSFHDSINELVVSFKDTREYKEYLQLKQKLKQDDNVTNTPTSDNTVSEDIDTNDTISNE